MAQSIGSKAFLLSSSCAVAIFGSAAHAQEVRQYRIAAGALQTSLQQFASQSDREILFDKALVANKQSKGFVGRSDAEYALGNVLVGTRLTFRQTGAGTLLVVNQVNEVQQQHRAVPARPQPAAGIRTEQAPQPVAAADPVSNPDIIVTGSRVSNGNNAPTPVTVVSLSQLQASTPSTIADGLRKLPSFFSSYNGTTINNARGNYVGAFLNLRGLGNNRNLVLLDGTRAMPTAADGSVDTNSLPELLVQRVDVVTGGASAVYGSDAISGVINYILDHKFVGLKLNVEGGLSGHDDDGSWKVGIAGGRYFLDNRLHIEASYQHYNSNGIGSKYDRSWAVPACRDGLGTAANPYHQQLGCTYAGTSYGGLITNGPAKGQQFADNGILSPFIHGTPTAIANQEIGGDGATMENSSLLARLRTDQAFARADYEVSNDVHAYLEGSWSRSFNQFTFMDFGAQTNALTYSTSNPFLTAAQQALLSSTGATSFTMAKHFLGEPMQIIGDTRTWNVAAGLNGAILGKVKWSIDYSHGESNLKAETLGNVDNDKLSAALDAVVNPSTGNVVCRTTLTNPGLYPGCVPLNPFGPTATNAQDFSWVQTNTYQHIINKVDDVNLTLTSELFDLPAGPVSVAANGEYRHVALDVTTPYPSSINQVCTGLVYNCSTTTTLYAQATGAPFSAAEDVTEGSLEVTLPIFKDFVLAKSFELNGAIRYTNYSALQKKGATTWKIGLTWKPIEDVTIRATRSRDIRAPSLFDLYAPTNAAVAANTDVHTGVTGQYKQLTSGNPDLVPEVAQNLTAGIVYRPSFFPRFSISVDYYKIKIDNAISQILGNPLTNQLCEASGGTSIYCALFQRPFPFDNHTAANFMTAVYGYPENIAVLSTNGVDVEANYSVSLGRTGDLSLRALASYQPHFWYQPGTGQTKYDQAGAANATLGTGGFTAYGSAKWKANFSATYTLDRLTVNLSERWRDKLKPSFIPTDVWVNQSIPGRAYTDLGVTYRFGGDENHPLILFANVQNLFNQTPAIYTPTTGVTVGLNPSIVGGDDVVGRYFTGGVRLRF